MDDKDAAPGPVTAGLSDAQAVAVVRAVNKSLPGTMTLRYESRDLEVDVSGDVAMRALDMFKRGRIDNDSPVDPDGSLAVYGRFAYTFDGLLSILWEPDQRAADQLRKNLGDIASEVKETSSEDVATDGAEGGDDVG